MKRLLALLAVIVLAPAAFAFDATRRAEKIAVLRCAETFDGAEQAVQTSLVRSLAEELRRRGFDAYQSELNYDDAANAASVDADYFIEIAGSRATSDEHGGIGVGVRHADVTFGVVVSRVAAELRIYDADTMELVDSQELLETSTAVLPTGVGIGGRSAFAWIALPFLQRSQYRSAARAAAREAAGRVADAVRASAD